MLSIMEAQRGVIQTHADTRLDVPRLADAPGEAIASFRRFLQLETERLRMRHRMGLGGIEITAARSYQVDMIVARAAQLAAARAGVRAQRELAQCAVVALGGYGRGELAPYSDVDLLFLRPERSSDLLPRFVEQVLQTLWDVGLTVGHSFRTVRECVAEAKGDLHSRTALTEARIVAGDPVLLESLRARLTRELGKDRRATAAFLGAMRADLAERRDKWGGSVCVLEPNVKEGLGGLRDIHAVLWVAHGRFSTRDGLSGLRAASLVSEPDYAVIRRAYDFLARVRNEAHFIAGRKNDLIGLDVQDELAEGLAWRASGGLLASEAFMREYYRRASEVHDFSRAFMVTHLAPPEARSFFGLGRRRHARKPAVKGGPIEVLHALARGEIEAVDLSEEVRVGLRQRAAVVEPTLRRSREASQALVQLLARRGHVGASLRVLHETGVLGRLVPEIGRVTFLVQHDLFHKYTVDEHTLRALEALDEAATGTEKLSPRLRRVFDEVEDATPLYLGMLLHDIGKGKGSGHVSRGLRIAPRVIERLGVSGQVADDALFLVGAHLEMSQISQQRDLSEAAVVRAFAERVATLERLNLLLLLTYADHRAVGPNIWNQWKASLLWDLYDRTRPLLATGEFAPADESEAARVRDAAVRDLLREFPSEEVLQHFSMLPERYFRTNDAATIVRHLTLLRDSAGAPAAVSWRSDPGGHSTELLVVARDRKGLFASLAGILTAHGIDILSVDLVTRADGVAFDAFRIADVQTHEPIPADRCERMSPDVVAAASGTYDVADAVARWQERVPKRKKGWGRVAREPRIRFDNDGSAASTIVEVRAPDQPGLAYTIARTLSGLGLDITAARITTEKALALDVFYVTDPEGAKLAEEGMERVHSALTGALNGPRKGEPRKDTR